MKTPGANVQRYVDAIFKSGLTIYDPVEIGDPTLWIPAGDLEAILAMSLTNTSLKGLPLRSRSKLVKTLVCRALGYPVPTVFRKTHPRFPGQCFDTYAQKSNNLQVWNEDLEPTRRYVIIRVTAEDIIARVKVVDGTSLALLDTTGTLTQKYQARVVPGSEPSELIFARDTRRLTSLVKMTPKAKLWGVSPIANDSGV